VAAVAAYEAHYLAAASVIIIVVVIVYIIIIIIFIVIVEVPHIIVRRHRLRLPLAGVALLSLSSSYRRHFLRLPGRVCSLDGGGFCMASFFWIFRPIDTFQNEIISA
jgi:hypothetical protein